jgi:hypothetical protein
MGAYDLSLSNSQCSRLKDQRKQNKMLDLFISCGRNLFSFNKLFFVIFCSSFLNISPLSAFEKHDGLTRPRYSEYEWVVRYFNSVDENTSIEELVDFLVSFKASLQAKGYKCPSLADLCLRLRDALIQQGVELDDDVLEEIYNEIVERENDLSGSAVFVPALNKKAHFGFLQIKKGAKKKEKKEVQISGKMAVGFVKFLGGALCCIVPIPAVQVVGATIAGAGVIEMIDAAKEEGDKNEIEQKIQGQVGL